MAVESANVEKVCEWLTADSSVRTSNPAADTLVGKLAALLFDGDPGWPSDVDRVDDYRDRLHAWFTGDSSREAHFASLSGADAEPSAFIDWFLPVVGEWESRAAQPAPAAAFQNPNWDGTPGTEFYRIDAATQQYLYAASAAGTDWQSYDQRRYTKPTRNDGYGLECRYDFKDGIYEWHDEATGTWCDQAWADQRAAQIAAGTGDTTPAAVGAAAADAPVPPWDENWGKFYRVGPDGPYEFADALVPGQQSSGCGDVWLSQDQALAQTAPGPAAGPEGATDTGSAASRELEEAVSQELTAAIAEIDGAKELSAEELAEIRAELIAEFGAGAA